MELEGKIIHKGETATFGSNGFQKREVVLETDDQYPQKIQVEFVQAKCELLDSFKEGDLVKIKINLRGREWVNPEGVSKYFNTIQGWQINKVGAAAPAPAAPAETQSGEEDALPF